MSADPAPIVDAEPDPEHDGGGGDGGDEQHLGIDESYFYPSKWEICERFGFLEIRDRDGFTYVSLLGEGEVLFSDFLKKQKSDKPETSNKVRAIK